jgi:predicted metal-dependent hydrolase
MTQFHAPIRYGASAFALVDNLMTLLKKKGIITEEESRQLIADAISGVQGSVDASVRDAADLLREAYRPL